MADGWIQHFIAGAGNKMSERRFLAMADGQIRDPIEVAGHVIARRFVVVEDDQLFVMFTVAGPDASPRFTKEHVVVIRPGDTEKLNSRGGHGGYESDGTAFFEWQFDWPGGNEVQILYVADGDQIVRRDLVTL